MERGSLFYNILPKVLDGPYIQGVLYNTLIGFLLTNNKKHKKPNKVVPTFTSISLIEKK